jgi:hypothetical protein
MSDPIQERVNQISDLTTNELAQAARIRKLFSSMPYGGSAHFTYPSRNEGWSLDDIEHNLTNLRAQLVSASKRDEAMTARLAQHDHLHAALGQFAKLIVDAAAEVDQ